MGDGDLTVVSGSGPETGAELVVGMGGSVRVRANGDNGGAGESVRVSAGGEVGTADVGDANVSEDFVRSAGECAASAAADGPTTLSLTAFAPAKKPSMKSALTAFPPWPASLTSSPSLSKPYPCKSAMRADQAGSTFFEDSIAPLADIPTWETCTNE